MPRMTVLAVRNPHTRRHRIVGVFTQKKRLWAALEHLGLLEDGTELIREGSDEASAVTYQYLCNAIRGAGQLRAVSLAHTDDDRLAVITEVEVNKIPETDELFPDEVF